MAATNLQLKGLGRKTLTQLAGKAKLLGMTSESYVRELVKEDLALDRKAKTARLKALMGSGRPIDESALDALVEAARTRHHRRTSKRG